VKNTLLQLYKLSKPGIVYGNLIHVIAGFLFAYRYGVSWRAFVGVVVGSVCLIASACVINNYIDRDIDVHMKRTKRRGFVVGLVSKELGLAYAVLLLAIGMIALVMFTNPLTTYIGVAAYVLYAFVYTYAKRVTVWSTLIGSVPGALPIVAGYTAVSNTVDGGAWALGALLVAWQVAHFYAIGVFRKKEYKAAHLPILPVLAKPKAVVWHIIVSCVLYAAALVALIVGGYIGTLAAVGMVAGAILWMATAFDGLKATSHEAWAKSVFVGSLYLTVALVVSSGMTVVLPW